MGWGHDCPDSYWALFLDFMTWSNDGKLTYDSMGYIYTVLSLCMGPNLGILVVLYLGSYLQDMYDMTSAVIRSRICAVINCFASVITFVFALTKRGFVFVDGHYEIGAQYDIVTALPVLTVVYMLLYTIRYAQVIGLHDILAVAGYFLIMISGALIEAAHRIGTTFVGVTIADVFIFVMLQNKMIDKARQQREILTKKMASQYRIMKSMAGIYTYVNYADFEENTIRQFDQLDTIHEVLDIEHETHSRLNRELSGGVMPEQQDKFLEYTDLSTLQSRMQNSKIISEDFCHSTEGWMRAQYIQIGDSVGGIPVRVIYAVRNIDDEKQNVEKWIRKSNIDELIGCYNRNAYEDDVAALENGEVGENLVYISVDVNGLKVINDSLGHEAGDAMLIGAYECMKQCYGSSGKLYRTGGDEFVALIYADETQLSKIITDMEEVTENWRGAQNEHLTVSCGYVAKKEMPGCSVREMAALADKRMYEAKNAYYQKSGVVRRGYRAAHVALCAMYSRILKINISSDSYQVVGMSEEDPFWQDGEVKTLSDRIREDAYVESIHPDDRQEYLSAMNQMHIRNYFRQNNKVLRVLYRILDQGSYRRRVLEIIPADDYSEENQTFFLYVKMLE